MSGLKRTLNADSAAWGPLAPYASYYYALALSGSRSFNQSRLVLKQLMDLFPDWRKMDDAKYLFAATAWKRVSMRMP